MRKIIYLFILAMIVSGCAATVPNLNGISLGITKQDVIKVLGNPNNVSAKNNVEYLKYNCGGSTFFAAEPGCVAPGGHGEWFVRIVDGKVESYGKVGDFDSTKDQVNVIKLETQK